jgi:hypothetical protein
MDTERKAEMPSVGQKPLLLRLLRNENATPNSKMGQMRTSQAKTEQGTDMMLHSTV